MRAEPPTRRICGQATDSQTKTQAQGGGSTHFVDVLLLHLRVPEHLLDRRHRAPEQVHVELLELRAGQRLREVVPALKRLDLDARRLLARQRQFRVLGLALELPHRAEVRADVGARLLLVLRHEVVDDTVVEVLAAEVHVPSGGEDLEHAVLDREEGDVERAAAEVVHDDL